MEHVDFMSTPLPTILLAQQEQLEEAELKIRRYDQGTTGYERLLERFPAMHSAVLTPKDVQAMFCSLTIYAETGRKTEAIAGALEELS